jgi:UDP-N-acetylmuramoylalanine--D-glutamate ligase
VAHLSLNLNGKLVCVIGAARSGISAANALKRCGANVLLSDSQQADRLDQDRIEEIRSSGVRFIAGASPSEAVPDGAELVVTSPGVWKSADVLTYATARNISIWSEIELAYRISPAPFIATTGTNGKTTTTLLIGRMLAVAGMESVVAGNISADSLKMTLVDAAVEAADKVATQRIISAEISSFQLEWTDMFAPWIGLLLNVTEDHLNRHSDFGEYFRAKQRMFSKQTERDFAVLNYDDESILRAGFENLRSTRLWFSAGERPVTQGPAAYVSGGRIVVEPQPGCRVEIMELAAVPPTLPGAHNVSNVVAAASAALLAGASADAIAEAVKEFRGVPHRMELVDVIADVRYINNSMCTNMAASIASIKAIGSPAILIAGGAGKGLDYRPMAEALERYVRKTILIGDAAPAMESAFRAGGYIRIARSATLEEAVALAAHEAAPGDAVVLSPACASFDMFRDFEHRGAAFRSAVAGLRRSTATEGRQ